MNKPNEIFEQYFEDYVVGEVSSGGTRTLTDTDITEFARLTGDFHPAHTNQQFANTNFGALLVHGALSFGIVVGLTVEYNKCAIAYGYDHIRFTNAVYAGDTISAISEVTNTADHRDPSIGLVTKHYKGTNQKGETVIICDHILAVRKYSEK